MAEVKKVNLKAAMIPHAAKLLTVVKPESVDTEVLVKYEDLPKNGIIDAFNSCKYATEALEACSVAKLHARVCKAFALAAKNEVSRLEAVKYFDAESQLTVKVTEGSKSAFVNMNPDVLAAKDIKNSWETLADYFENSMFDFKDRHYWYKTIFQKDMQTGDNIGEAE